MHTASALKNSCIWKVLIPNVYFSILLYQWFYASVQQCRKWFLLKVQTFIYLEQCVLREKTENLQLFLTFNCKILVHFKLFYAFIEHCVSYHRFLLLEHIVLLTPSNNKVFTVHFLPLIWPNKILSCSSPYPPLHLHLPLDRFTKNCPFQKCLSKHFIPIIYLT